MDNEKRKTAPKSGSNDNGLKFSDVADFFFLCLAQWKWFLLSLIVCVGCAFLYIKTTPPKYTRNASVHIKEDSRGNSIGNISEEFANLGFGSTGGSVNNEVAAFNSVDLAKQVVRELRLDISYYKKSGLRKELLFGHTLPITVTFPSLDDKASLVMKVEMLPSGELLVDEFTLNKEEKAAGQRVRFDEVVNIGGCDMLFSKTPEYKTPEKAEQITIVKSTFKNAASALHTGMVATQNNNKNSVIDLTYSDYNMERAEAVLNTCISEYNKSWMMDKNELGVMTSQFINERINMIERELGGVDSDIAEYKSSNLITDPMQAAQMFMQQANASDQQMLALNNQIFMCRYLREYVANSSNVDKLIPVNVGISSADVNKLIADYNTLLLDKNACLRNSSEKNPLVINMNENLTAQRSAILQSIDNEQRSLEAQLRSSQKTFTQSTSVLSKSPVYQRQLLSMDRQQKIKEALYLFLLQKREENELSQAFTAYNTRIISHPYGTDTPTSPKTMMIFLMAIILGFAIPMAFIYFRESLNTKVRGRVDIDSMSVPFMGEIPLSMPGEQKSNVLVKSLLKGERKPELKLAVQDGKHNAINEAFRIIRSNLNFMLSPNDDVRRKVILVTSANPFSGKTFVSINLATVFSFQNDTRVAVVDLDIRKASVSNFAGKPKSGVTDYLGGFESDWHSLMVKLAENSKVDLLPVGHFPPNPSELLQSKRLATLLEEMKQEYDIIFLDMPPVEIVADVTVVKHLADITMFVIRTGLLERSMLPVIEKYYIENQFNNFTLLLNGSDLKSHKYSRYGYGYGYGYGYNGYTDQKE